MNTMPYYVDSTKMPVLEGAANRYQILLGPENGCVNECLTGLSYYYKTEYPEAQAHLFQEGFYVVSGEGYAHVGDQEFPIHAGVSFLAPAHTYHTVKSSNPDVPVVLFWFHAS